MSSKRFKYIDCTYFLIYFAPKILPFNTNTFRFKMVSCNLKGNGSSLKTSLTETHTETTQYRSLVLNTFRCSYNRAVLKILKL